MPLIFGGKHSDLPNNVLSTLLLCCVLIALIESKKAALPHRKKLIWGFVLQQLAGLVATATVMTLAPAWTSFVMAICPSLLLVEGSFIFVLMGIFFYFYRDHPKALTFSFLCCCFIFFAPALLSKLLLEQYQWMMVLSLPLILSYNGQRGRQMKYLFYVFYPAHLFILYVLSQYII